MATQQGSTQLRAGALSMIEALVMGVAGSAPGFSIINRGEFFEVDAG